MIDLYCERLGPGLWAEPVNALTNAVFFVAAWAIWRNAQKLNARDGGTGLLIGLTVVIGIGIFLLILRPKGFTHIAPVEGGNR